jgi:anti-sigma-K factor RskA
VYAIGAMQLETLAPELDRVEHEGDPALKQTVQNARRRLAGLAAETATPQEPAPPTLGMGVGAG